MQQRIDQSLEESMYEFFGLLNEKVQLFNDYSKIVIGDAVLEEALESQNRALILDRINFFKPVIKASYMELIDIHGNYYTESNLSSDARLTRETIDKLLQEIEVDSDLYFFHRDDGVDIKYVARGTLQLKTDFEGLVVFTFSLDNQGLLIDYFKTVIQKDIFLINDGKVIASTFFDFDTMERLTDIPVSSEITDVLDKDVHYQNDLLLNEEKYVIRYQYLELNRRTCDTIVALAVDKNEITTFLRNSIIIIINSAVIIFILVFLFSLFIASKITKPISILSKAAKDNAKGKFVTVEIFKNNEIGEFAKDFNVMVSELKNTQKILEERVKQRTLDLEASYEKLRVEYERNKEEISLAKKMQQAILPDQLPNTDSITITGKYYPMDDLGGDFYDVYQIDNDKVAVLILDVSGHGVPAALITTMAKIAFQSNLLQHSSTKEILKAVNNEIAKALGSLTEFLTAFLCIIDMSDKKMIYTNAGHPSGFVLRNNEEPIVLSENSPFVGVMEDLEYYEAEFDLLSNDKIVLYTDGIIEAQNAKSELLGEQHFVEILKENMNNKEDFFYNVFKKVESYREGNPPNDDMAIITIDIH